MQERMILHKHVRIWLILGLALIFGQILIGGVTRLTGSGLSITKWEIVTGTLPPLNEKAWEEEFALYQSTPQYRLINHGMSISQFKMIYFWEYLHRLWARWMGLIFLFPFVWFWRKGLLHPALLKRLGILILLAGITASFGWIMVASGLIERPWVNAYKLSAHLLLGFSVFIYLLYILVREQWPDGIGVFPVRQRQSLLLFIGLIILQIFLGGMMSGMKAGFTYPTWPDMNGVFIPDVMLKLDNWTVYNLVHYDDSGLMVALVQWLHRLTAYVLIIIGLRYFLQYLKANSSTVYKQIHIVLVIVLVTQIVLGIATVLGFQKGMPVLYASMHQMCALILLSLACTELFWNSYKSNSVIESPYN
ncbi:MAG: COX15/CtaA family protein [Saprospiraceae bacterium]|nr:COX15/CtaA family protein [Saprospiraceae bacterium]